MFRFPFVDGKIFDSSAGYQPHYNYDIDKTERYTKTKISKLRNFV